MVVVVVGDAAKGLAWPQAWIGVRLLDVGLGLRVEVEGWYYAWAHRVVNSDPVSDIFIFSTICSAAFIAVLLARIVVKGMLP